MKINGKEYFPTNHGFLLHTEYIHHEDYFEEDAEEDFEIEEEDEEDEEYDSWKEFINKEEQEDRKEEKKIHKLESVLYPVFMHLEIFKTNIETVYPTIVWKLSETEIIENKRIDLWYGEVYTSNGHLIILAISENDVIYRPIRIDIKLTDFPFIEVRKISKFLNTYLFHFNSLQYLDLEDDGEVEKDLFQSFH
jgi:hypothetical protein